MPKASSHPSGSQPRVAIMAPTTAAPSSEPACVAAVRTAIMAAGCPAATDIPNPRKPECVPLQKTDETESCCRPKE